MRSARPVLCPARLPGFTLVELLVVIGIIGVLIAILLPALAKARTNAQRAQCLSNEKQIALAILMYTTQNQGLLPGPCVPSVADPLIVNVQVDDPPEVYTGGTWVSGGSKLTVWDSGPYYSNRELSNMFLLQQFLGGPSNSNIWYCPASRDNVGQAYPANSGSIFANKHLGYGYIVNNLENTSAYNTGTSPDFLFGSYNNPLTTLLVIPGSGAGYTPQSFYPKKVNQIYAYVGATPTSNADINTNAETRGFVTTASKIWILSDVDGRNWYTSYSATFGIAVPTGSNDTHAYQPCHVMNSQVPGGLGRNYAYLDGHAEFIGFYDWPDNPRGAALSN